MSSSFEHQQLDGLLAKKMAEHLISMTPADGYFVDLIERNGLTDRLYSFLRNEADCPMWAHAFGFTPIEHEED